MARCPSALVTVDVLPQERVRPNQPPACSHRYSSSMRTCPYATSSAAYSPPAARAIYRARLPLALHTRRVFAHAWTARPRAPALPPGSQRARGGREDQQTMHAESHACVAAGRDARQAEILLSAFPSAPHLCLSSNTDAFVALKASLEFRGSSARPALYVVWKLGPSEPPRALRPHRCPVPRVPQMPPRATPRPFATPGHCTQATP